MSIAVNKSLTQVIASLNSGLLRFAPLIPALIPVLINLWISSIDQISVRNQMWKIEYDYIIIGAGSAGTILANRLAKTKYTILLLEAGGNENFFNEIPALSHAIQQTSMDWQYVTEPQEKACLGLNNRQSLWPRGRALGGSSVMDDMLYFNGNPEDFDGWEREGAEGWSWDAVRRFFPVKEIDQYISEHLSDADVEHHMKMPEIKLTVPSTTGPLSRAFMHSGHKLNYSLVKLNIRSQIGFSVPHFTINKGRRESSAKIYLRSVRKNKNLDVVNNAFVKKIIIDGNLTATGVEFDRFGQIYKIKAKQEVILSAGAINSPQLLMLSGIGPKKHLQSIDIPLIKDLPVGHNLQDQFGTQLSFSVNKNKVFNVHKDMDSMNFLKYMLFSEGLLSNAPIDAFAFINTDNTTSNVPNVQIILKPMSIASDNGLTMRKIYGINDNLWKYYAKHVNKDSISIVVNLLHPKSRGTIELKSKDPYDSPKIDPKYYSRAEDMNTIIEALKIVRKLVDSKWFYTLQMTSFGKPEECNKFEEKSSEFIECFARHLTLSGNSPVGTCRMGRNTSAEAVVDPQLRVIGIKGLRVADASVMPSLISGNPYATTLMIGQRMASFIINKDKDLVNKVLESADSVFTNGLKLAVQMVSKYYGLHDLEKMIDNFDQ